MQTANQPPTVNADLSANVVECPLPGRQQRVIVALLEAPTNKAAAKLAGISPKTLTRWLREPAFKAALVRAQAEAFAAGVSGLKATVSAAVERLRCSLGSSDARVALAAARVVIENGLRCHEVLELSGRLAALEERLNATDEETETP